MAYNPELVRQELAKKGIYTKEQFLEAYKKQKPIDIERKPSENKENNVRAKENKVEEKR